MNDQYFINRNGKIRGPVGRRNIRKLFDEGKVRSADLISSRADGDWISLETFLKRVLTESDVISEETLASDQSVARRPMLAVAIATLSVMAVLAAALRFALYPATSGDAKSVKPPVVGVVSQSKDERTSSFKSPINLAQSDQASPQPSENSAPVTAPKPAMDAGIAALVGASTEWEWSEPERADWVEGEGSYTGTPAISRDGLTVAFSSVRPGGHGSSDIWFARRETIDAAWPKLENAGNEVNSSASDWSPSLSSDGSILYYHSHRPGSQAGDIWSSSWDRSTGKWSKAVLVEGAVNSEGIEQQPAIAPDGLQMILWSNGRKSRSGGELWQHKRGSLAEPFDLGEKVRAANPSLADVNLLDVQFYGPDSLSALFSVRNVITSDSEGFLLCRRATVNSPWTEVKRVTVLPRDAYDVAYSPAARLLLIHRGQDQRVWQMRLVPRIEDEPLTSLKMPQAGELPPAWFATDWIPADSASATDSLRDKTVLLHFWSASSSLSVNSLTKLDGLQEKYRDKGFHVVSLTEDDRDTIELFLKERSTPINHPIGAGSATGKIYGIHETPTAVLFQYGGTILWSGSPSAIDCDNAIAKALGVELPVEVNQPSSEIQHEVAKATPPEYPCQQVIAEVVSRPDYGSMKSEMTKRVRALRSELSRSGIPEALIVAGKIELPETDPEMIDSSIAIQCEVFSGGYFVTVLGDKTRPLFVTANQYLPTEIRFPADIETAANVLHIAPVVLQAVTKSTEAVIAGNVSLRPRGIHSQVHLSFQPKYQQRVNHPVTLKSDGRILLSNPKYKARETFPGRDGTFSTTGISPMPHRLIARSFGYEIGECDFDGKKLKPENLFLEAVPQYLMTTVRSGQKDSGGNDVTLVSQSSKVFESYWFKISRSSPKDSQSKNIVIEPGRGRFVWATLEGKPEESRTQISRLLTLEFAKPETIEAGRTYFVATAEKKADWIAFSLTPHELKAESVVVNEMTTDQVPAAFRAQYVDKVEQDLKNAPATGPREIHFGITGQVTSVGTPLPSGAIAVDLRTAGPTNLVRTELIDGSIAFCSSKATHIVGGSPAMLSLRGFGYESIEEPLPVEDRKLLCMNIAVQPVKTESQSDLLLDIVDAYGKPVSLATVALRFHGVGAVYDGSRFTELQWTQKSDREGKVIFPRLASDWYRIDVEHDQLRSIRQACFIERAMKNEITVQLRPRRSVAIEFVSAPDGTGRFRGKPSVIEIREGATIPLSQDLSIDGEMSLSKLTSNFGFTKSGCWIVDLGKTSFAEVDDALSHQPKQIISGFASQPPTIARCRTGHVYVVQIPSKQHLKFRVLSITEPTR